MIVPLTLRNKLTLIYLATIVLPFVILAFVLPYNFQRTIAAETEKLTQGTLNAVSRNIETYLEDLERLTTSPYLNDNVIQALILKSENLYDSADDYTKLQTERALTGPLPNYLVNMRRDILSAITIPMTGDAYLTTRYIDSELAPDFPFTAQDWYKEAISADGHAAFIGSHPQDYLENQKVPQVFSVARLIKDPNSGKPLAVVLADADTVVLEKIIKDVSFNVSSVVAVLDRERQLLYANKPISESVMAQIVGNRRLIRDGDAAYSTVTKKIEPADWEIVILLSNSEAVAKVRWIYIVAGMLALGGIVVTFVLFLFVSQWIVKPFKRMIKVMQSVKRGDLQSRFATTGQDEIAQVGLALNSMIERLGELINSEYKAVLAQRNAEYKALQSQIQPHFLYNTLNGLIGLNRVGDKRQLEKAILSLSGMLRYILDEQQWSSLENEFAFLRNYSMLQQLRFEDKLVVRFHCDEVISGFRIPKLLLQPLFENAVIHGAEPSETLTEITVEAKLVSGPSSYVHIIVKDNGAGYDSKSGEREDNKSRVGIANVQSRLKFAFPEAEMDIAGSQGQGTIVTMMIPANL